LSHTYYDNAITLYTLDIAPPTSRLNGKANIAFSAAVTNASQNQIAVKLNGASVSFTLTNNVVTASLTAVPGANNIEIVAINECGNSSDRLAITYTQPVVVPPCIAPTATIASPASNTSLTEAGFALTATVTNATSNQVVVKLNGATVPFILTGNTITVQMTAISGTNTIEVMATNDCGNQTDNVVVNYNPCVSPTASISSPANNTALSGSSFTISANVTNVIRNQIAVKLNNIDVPFYTG
jgi:hypothetical protein